FSRDWSSDVCSSDLTSSNGTAWTRVLSTTSRRMGRTRNGMDGTGQRYGRRRRVANRTGKPPTPGARRAQALPPPRGEEGLGARKKKAARGGRAAPGIGDWRNSDGAGGPSGESA